MDKKSCYKFMAGGLWAKRVFSNGAARRARLFRTLENSGKELLVASCVARRHISLARESGTHEREPR